MMLITNFDYLARQYGIQALNECGEQILTNDEIIKLILPNYLKEDPWGQYAICLNLVGVRRAPKFYTKIQKMIEEEGGITNETLDIQHIY